jgi:hypothetical protein
MLRYADHTNLLPDLLFKPEDVGDMFRRTSNELRGFLYQKIELFTRKRQPPRKLEIYKKQSPE